MASSVAWREGEWTRKIPPPSPGGYQRPGTGSRWPLPSRGAHARPETRVVPPLVEELFPQGELGAFPGPAGGEKNSPEVAAFPPSLNCGVFLDKGAAFSTSHHTRGSGEGPAEPGRGAGPVWGCRQTSGSEILSFRAGNIHPSPCLHLHLLFLTQHTPTSTHEQTRPREFTTRWYRGGL